MSLFRKDPGDINLNKYSPEDIAFRTFTILGDFRENNLPNVKQNLILDFYFF